MHTAMTCARFARTIGKPPRPYGYTIAIVPPIPAEPTPPREEPVDYTSAKACDSCGLPTRLSQLHDITSCGDWLTVCGQCRDKIQGPPQPQTYTGWYKHKADAERIAARLDNPVTCTCHLKENQRGPVPHHCAAHDGDYLSFLALHNCD